ncbi:MAG: chorion class high-cysteine HCB protein 13 [Lachnospiraceae bacterium]|nr:chorion class high-cysteine HCB protein 13 [Lachnospiraceae bacterium]
MSDLAATNCNGGCGCDSGNSCSSLIFILLILFCCGGCGNGCGENGMNCDAWIIILLLLFCCNGNGNGCCGF